MLKTAKDSERTQGLRPNWNGGMMEFWNDGFKGIGLIEMIFSTLNTQFSRRSKPTPP